MNTINNVLYTLAKEVYRHKSAYNVSMYMREKAKFEHVANSHMNNAITHMQKEEAVREAIKALGFTKKELEAMLVHIDCEEADSL